MDKLEGWASELVQRLRRKLRARRRARVYLVFMSAVDDLDVSTDVPEILKAAFRSRIEALWYLSRLKLRILLSRSRAYSFHTRVTVDEIGWGEGFFTYYYDA